MDCKRANDLLVGYLYQELDVSEVGPMEAHLETCAQCAHRLESLQIARATVQRLPVLEPPAHITDSLVRAAAAALEHDRRSLWERLRDTLRFTVMHPAMTAAVTLVVVIGISFFAYQRSAPPDRAGRSGDLPEVHYLPLGTETTAQLRGERGGEGALPELSNKEVDTTASIAARDEDAADDPRRGRRIRNNEKWANEKLPLARQTAEVGRQAPMDNRRHVGTRGLWKGKQAGGGVASTLDGVKKRKRRRRPAATRSKAEDLDDRNAVLLAARQPRPAPSAPRRDKAGPGAAAMQHLKLAEAAMVQGNCTVALQHYDRALTLSPGLAGQVRPNVERCVATLGRDGKGTLAQARKRYPTLAGYFQSEIRRRRARARPAKPAVRKTGKARKAAPAQVDAY